MFCKLAREGTWKIATTHDGVLISHAGVSQAYWKQLGDASITTIADNFNKRFQHIDNRDIADNFWERDSPLWFRPGLMTPLPGLVQVVGHTPPEHILPEFRETYISVDPYARGVENFPDQRWRYATIEDGVIEVCDSHDFQRKRITV